MRLGWVERKHLPVDPRLRPGWLRQKRPYQSPAEFTTLPQKPALEAVTGGKVLNTAGSGRAAGELRARAPRAEPALGQWEPEVGGECGAAAGPIRLQARPGGGDGRRWEERPGAMETELHQQTFLTLECEGSSRISCTSPAARGRRASSSFLHLFTPLPASEGRPLRAPIPAGLLFMLSAGRDRERENLALGS